MRANSKELYRLAMQAYINLMRQIEIVRNEIQNEPEKTELADDVLIVKKSLALIENMRTQFNTLERLSITLTCGAWMRDQINEPIRTPYCTASPKISMAVQTPNRKKQPVEYREFCQALGVPDEVIESGTFQPHWPSMLEYISNLAEKGEPLPPHCDPAKMYPVYACAVRKQRDILDTGDVRLEGDE